MDKKPKLKKPNLARTISFLFKLKKVIIKCENGSGEEISLEKKHISKILKFNRKQIKDLYNFMDFIYQEKETKNNEEIALFDVKYKLLLCLIKAFYIRFGEKNLIKIPINSMEKIFSIIKLSQSERMEYIILYQIEKADDYHGNKIILLGSTGKLKKKFKRNLIGDKKLISMKNNENINNKENVSKEGEKKFGKLKSITNIFERNESNVSNTDKNFNKEERKIGKLKNLNIFEKKINDNQNKDNKSKDKKSEVNIKENKGVIKKEDKKMKMKIKMKKL